MLTAYANSSTAGETSPTAGCPPSPTLLFSGVSTEVVASHTHTASRVAKKGAGNRHEKFESASRSKAEKCRPLAFTHTQNRSHCRSVNGLVESMAGVDPARHPAPCTLQSGIASSTAPVCSYTLSQALLSRNLEILFSW